MTRDLCWLTKPVTMHQMENFSLLAKDEIANSLRNETARLFGITQEVAKDGDLAFQLVDEASLGIEGFRLECLATNRYQVVANTTKGLLYGLFSLYEKIVLQETFASVESVPDQALRMINHWDNLDGTIERGYAGDSIFFKDNTFRKDYNLISEYARLLASVGINALSINNVNVRGAAKELICEKNFAELRLIYDIFRSYGIKMYLCVNFAAPISIGGLTTADPLDKQVQDFWQGRIAALYRYMPEFGGFVVKADSEGEPGPFAYGRGHDDGANMFANLLHPYGGHLIWRCFVYNHQQDWRDRSIDRARAAYDHFMPLDGNFSENVSLQIKLGPLDFQVREPISPLLSALRKTNHIIEFQLTQEYTGHQKAVYYQLPVWKEALDFDCCNQDVPGQVKSLLKSTSPQPERSGICAVGVVGMTENWTGHKLMQINLYGYGKLCWDNQLTTEACAKRWVGLTFALDAEAAEKLVDLLVTSRETYSLYTAPRGVGFMVKPNTHDGPSVDGYEYDRWGTYHFADHLGIGNDRTTNGTDYVSQYAPAVRDRFNSLATCPDELLLWFHHVPYTHQLHNGKTLIQDIYDNHFEGVERVEAYQRVWEEIGPKVDQTAYENVKALLQWQRDLAVEWRDQINTYFYRKSGISDVHKRLIYP